MLSPVIYLLENPKKRLEKGSQKKKMYILKAKGVYFFHIEF